MNSHKICIYHFKLGIEVCFVKEAAGTEACAVHEHIYILRLNDLVELFAFLNA